MLNEIQKNIFLVEVPLPKNPLRALNCYFIKNGDNILVIDSGFDHEESEKIFFEALEELGAKIGKTDMFLTHLHADHSGLALKFKNKYQGKVYCSQIDTDYINQMKHELYADRFVPTLKVMGIEPDFKFFETHPGLVYCVKGKLDTTIVKDGDIIDFGDYKFEVIDLSGHTPGQVGIYDKQHKILFSGDHILNKITPNISFWEFKYEDILGTYLKNLDKVYSMEVDVIYSAHRGIIDNPKTRIDELKKHYADRNEEVYNLLKDGEKFTAVDIARKMHWDYRANNFDEFPNNQKWFATGEALANLEHLRAIGKARMDFANEVAFYSVI
ncbi:MBL fold metallo-hydrolase [Fusobacterium massiliense]|uniref:MBL fold metallo-hydrolase n=1 Tax=Fusobacterium massiliense TaxID=1852365 RepID=UPI0028E4F211|nr:MBL fold metallo-hydrolase [Fusobacterium massiliense]